MAWDTNSGIRERLALLASKGPDVDPSHWGYNPSRDIWCYCGPVVKPIAALPVKQEGSASLAIIAERWNLDRPSAMRTIGHPERT